MQREEAGKDGVQANQEPTIAVALRYEMDDDAAPVVVASGRGSLADRILTAAEEAGVAIDENPMLAQALEKAPVGEPIPEELYQAVAEVIGWVLNHGHGRIRHALPSAERTHSGTVQT
ncbi:MAG: EscU/YscU/HrcU family type III secretion system export apparatus switch protein [Pseudomonadota bacterium]